MSRSRQRRLWLSIVSSLSLLVTLPSSLAADQTSSTDESTLRSGTSLGNGTRAGAACLFSDLKPVELDQDEWVVVHVDDLCRASVRDGWRGAPSDGPEPYASMVVRDAAADRIDFESSNVTAAAATVCKTSKQYVSMYGLAGPVLDRLTHVWNQVRFCYTDSYVWVTSLDGSACAGQDEAGWSWVMDSCVYTSQQLNQSSTMVWSVIRGNFHCAPLTHWLCASSNPDGYFHRIFNRVQAVPSGHSTCTFWYDGQIVSGVDSDILAGCN